MNIYATVTLGKTTYSLDIKEGSLDCEGYVDEVTKLYVYNESTDEETYVYDEYADLLMDEMEDTARQELEESFMEEEAINQRVMSAEYYYEEMRGN